MGRNQRLEPGTRPARRIREDERCAQGQAEGHRERGEHGRTMDLQSPPPHAIGSSRSGDSNASSASTGRPALRHASKPPSSGRTRSIPRFFNWSATRALEASFGQAQ